MLQNIMNLCRITIKENSNSDEQILLYPQTPLLHFSRSFSGSFYHFQRVMYKLPEKLVQINLGKKSATKYYAELQ